MEQQEGCVINVHVYTCISHQLEFYSPDGVSLTNYVVTSRVSYSYKYTLFLKNMCISTYMEELL